MRYYSTQRPVTIGSFPNPADNRICNIVNFECRMWCETIHRKAWGYIDYTEPLTDDEMEKYELVFGGVYA